MTTCRLIQDGSRSGAWNMAIDEALLRVTEEGASIRTTFRLYLWERPTVSLGYAQKPERAADMAFCRRQGIPVVRRPTGGRAVLHAGELTYAVVSNDPGRFGGTGIHSTYLTISRVLHRALQSIGCPAEISPGDLHRRQEGASIGGIGLSPQNSGALAEPCFQSTSRAEITAGGRKIVGSAQRRLQRAFLQHGSILIHCDIGIHAAALGADPDALRRSFAGLDSFIGEPDIEMRLREAIAESIEPETGLSPIAGELDEQESLAAIHFLEMGRHTVSATSPNPPRAIAKGLI